MQEAYQVQPAETHPLFLWPDLGLVLPFPFPRGIPVAHLQAETSGVFVQNGQGGLVVGVGIGPEGVVQARCVLQTQITRPDLSADHILTWR